MNARRLFSGLCLSVLCLSAASPALGLANRVFVSARSGNDVNTCDDVSAPCKTFAGAVTKLNPDGELIVLDSGGYGKVTITQGVTIEAAAGVTAFIHPSSGDAVTIGVGGATTVTLRGLVLNVGSNNGITVNSVGTLNVENCHIAGFENAGIQMNSAGRLNVKGTDITACGGGISIMNGSGVVQASIDHCHLDGNFYGFYASTTSPGGSTTSATHTTANHNLVGWVAGNMSSGKDVLDLEFCTGSESLGTGLGASSTNAASAARYSNCVFANNSGAGVSQSMASTVESRGNNTITGNGLGATAGVIGTFLPM